MISTLAHNVRVHCKGQVEPPAAEILPFPLFVLLLSVLLVTFLLLHPA